MVSINTNISSLIAQNSLRNSTSKLNNAIEQMTTGYKINHAKDNAANYSIAIDMSTKIGAYEIAEDNCAMALDLVNTAHETYDLIADKCRRLLNLQEQYENGTYNDDSKKAMNKEAAAISKELKRLAINTEYNEQVLFGYLDSDGNYNESTFNFHIGINDSISNNINVTTSSAEIAYVIYNTAEMSEDKYFEGTSIEGTWEPMLNIIFQKQTELGAVQNRLESALEEISTKYENLTSSRSTLKDSDVAEVSSQYIKQQILQQASATLLATANQTPSIALQLL